MKKSRYWAVIIITFGVFMGLCARLIYVTVVARDEILSKAQSQILQKLALPAKRGSIVDRNGALLASSTEAYRVDVDLTTFRRKLEKTDREASYYAAPLAEVLEMEVDEVLSKLTSESTSIILKRKIEKDTIDALRTYIGEANIDFLVIGYDDIRYFPNSNYLSQVLGAVNIDGEGIMGLEYYYEDLLKGVDGIKIAETDKQRRELPYSDVIETPAINGSDLYLTIDEKIQYIVEKTAEAAMEKHEADSVTILVSDPKTGGVLGLVNLPDFDPNKPFEGKNSDEFNEISRNFAVNDSYEPGSTFKIVTISAALEEGVIGEHELFHCDGFIYVNGVRIKCVNNKAHGDQTAADVLKNSCNVATIQIAQRLGAEKFNEYLKKFQFGAKSGIDLPGEASGIIFKLEDLTPINLATSSFGQAQTVTPVQMLNAMNTVANGGVMIPLHVAEKAELTDVNGEITVNKLNQQEGNPVISEHTAESMLQYLYDATGKKLTNRAYIEGINVFGKTGTAQKIVTDENGKQKYSDEEYISSFIGGAPYEDPKITVLVIVNNPKDEIFGSIIASPWAREIFLEVDQYLSLR